MIDQETILAEVRQFMKSRVILSAAELDFFTLLDEDPAGSQELAERLGLDPRATARLLDCVVTFGLLSKDRDRYRTTEAGALLSSACPESIRPMVMHYGHLWNNWSHLSESVRLGENPHRSPVTKSGGERLEAFIGAMHVVGRKLAAEVARACDPDRFERLLDIGGGSGTYTSALLRRNPRLMAVLFDLPDVVGLAEMRLREEGLLDRVTLAAGDFYTDELPAGCDLALLSAIIHQNNHQQNVELFRKVHRALAPGGVLIIRDHVMNEARTHPPRGALFALNMLVCTDGGDTYTLAEIEDALAQAGFTEITHRQVGESMDSLVEARRS